MAELTTAEITAISHVLNYSPDTGEFTWKMRPVELFSGSNPLGAQRAWNSRYAGEPALANNCRGYLSGVIFGRRHMAHRIAWAMNSGTWPSDQIDHIDGNPSNNRIDNLRVVTPVENQWNSKVKKTKKDGKHMRGANWHVKHKKWSASIRIHLGYFNSQDEAHAAYEAAAEKMHGKFYLANGVRTDP